ncbi:MAG: SH3 domain-containing protein [Anaerolineales bacterium]|nr:MAG: SH3 domain-containing protein [Anaerolineales bacterium]
MSKQVSLLIGLVIALTMTSTAFAQEPILPQHSAPYWQVSYWNNPTLSGPPVVQHSETHLDHDWGNGSPAPGVTADRFSARWTRYIDVAPGTYRFTATADDGIRVWVDNDLIIDQWKDQPPTTYTAQKHLGQGHHLIKVEYYENLGVAVAKVGWTQELPQPKGAWRGEYYNNKSLSGIPMLVLDEPAINFHWGNSSPAPGMIDADGFSARWSRSLDLTAGTYRFTMTVDDGARLYVNGHLLIDAWKDQPARTYTGDIYLPGASASIQMEYYENTGRALAVLDWAPADAPPPPPPDLTGTVTASKLNIRSGPSLYYGIMGWVYRGQQVQLLGRDTAGMWLKVEVAPGLRGWVHAYYLRTSVAIADLPVI